MGHSIFRKEAIENTKARWMGKALLLPVFSVRLTILCSIAFIIVLLAFLISGNYTRRINVYGEVISQPHAMNIFSPQQGFITRTWVAPGDTVKKGDHIYEINVAQITSNGNVSVNAQSAIQNQVHLVDNITVRLEENKRSTLENIKQQLEQYRAAHKKLKSMVDNAARGMEDMRRSMENYKSYLRQGLITTEQLTNQRYMYHQQQSMYQSLNSQYIQEGLEIVNLENELSVKSADFDNQIAQYKVQNSDLGRQLSEVNASGALFIDAPADGRVETLSVTDGQMVNPGDSLVQLSPLKEHSYSLVLWIPDNSVPYIKRGDKINIRYEAFPYEKFGQFPGTINSISRVPASAQEMSKYNNVAPTRPEGQRTPYYKVIVSLKDKTLQYQGKSLNLSSGLKAQATLFLEKRPLYQWMLSPFYDIKKSMTGPIDE